MSTAQEDLEALRVGRARVDELATVRSSSTAGKEQSKAESGILTANIRDLQAADVTRDGELGVMERVMWSLKGRDSAGEARANMGEDRGQETLNKMFERWALVKGLNRSFGVACTCVAGLVNEDL